MIFINFIFLYININNNLILFNRIIKYRDIHNTCILYWLKVAYHIELSKYKSSQLLNQIKYKKCQTRVTIYMLSKFSTWILNLTLLNVLSKNKLGLQKHFQCGTN